MNNHTNDQPYNNEPFNADRVVTRGSNADANGFYNPMYDIMEGTVPPGLDPPVVPIDIPTDLKRALDETPQAKVQFERLSTMRRRKIISSLEGDNHSQSRDEHVLNIVRNLIVESRKDAELGLE